VICLAPRVPGGIVGSRRLSDVVARPLNFTVRRPSATIGDTHLRYDSSRHFDSAPEARRAGS